MTTDNKCGRCNGKRKLYSLNDLYNWDCPRCNGKGIDPLWDEITRLKAALGAIHKEAVYRFGKGHALAPDWARVQCEQALPELKQKENES